MTSRIWELGDSIVCVYGAMPYARARRRYPRQRRVGRPITALMWCGAAVQGKDAGSDEKRKTRLSRRRPILRCNRHQARVRWQGVHVVGAQGASRVHPGGDSGTLWGIIRYSG
jgi:hypothetical protein